MASSEYKLQKKKWNKARRKATRGLKGLAITCAVLAVIFGALLYVIDWMPKFFRLLLTSSDYTVTNTDDSAVYYESAFETDEERVAAGVEVAEEVAAEGITLLLNEDDVLPLASGTKVSLFGYGSVDLTYGGTGSAGLDTSTVSTLKDGFEAVGLEVNETLWDFYESGDGSADSTVASGSIATEDTEYISYEPSLETFTDDIWESVEEYSTVFFTISRIGGEGADLPTESEQSESGGYLALSDNERAVLQYLADLKDEGVVDCIILILNSSNTIQLDFIDDDEYGIDAILYVGGLGSMGVEALSSIVVGEVNPSGHLGDTYLADNLSSPAMVNWGAEEYTNAEEAGLSADDDNLYYTVYQEGIYVGYRYYETRYEDYVMGTGNAGDYDYSADVAFAFGYGLSYTDFEWSDYSVEYDEGEDVYVVTVTVTNVGDVAGKDVVEVYVQSPYTDYDVENGVEKASVVLVGFAKTDELEPGESQTLTIEVDGSDIASYDTYGYGTYIMDAGTYYLTAAEDAHSAVNNVLAAKGYTPANTSGRMDDEGDASMVWSWEEDELDYTTYSVSDNGTTIENQLSEADLNLSSIVGDQSITYLSRSDWEGTWPTEYVSLYATDEMAAELATVTYDADTYDGAFADAVMPTLEADNGLTLMDLYGLDYDDELWDDLLDQLSAEDMASLLGDAFHFTNAVESIGLVGTRDENGPTGLTTSLFGSIGDIASYDTMGLPSEDLMAATWNVDLLYEAGYMIGQDCLYVGVTFLYGPGANTHRTPYGGRNFEYFSEDGFLAGKLLAAEVSAIESTGTHVMCKHFALNDQETERIGIGMWLNEQTAREIYLRAFQYALEENELAGVMTSYTRWGCTWSGGNYNLITNIMRGEWGSLGVAITDNSQLSHYYMSGMAIVLAGADIADSMAGLEEDQLMEYLDDPVIVSAMREAVHRVAYAVLNSHAVNGLTSDSVVTEVTPWHVTLVTVLIIISGAGMAAFVGLYIHKVSRFRRANPKPRKEDFVS